MLGRKRVLVRTLVIVASALVAFFIISSSPAEATGGGESLPPPGPSTPVAPSAGSTSSLSQLGTQSGGQVGDDTVSTQPVDQSEINEANVDVPDNADMGSSSQDSSVATVDAAYEDDTPPTQTDDTAAGSIDSVNLQDVTGTATSGIVEVDIQADTSTLNIRTAINGFVQTSSDDSTDTSEQSIEDSVQEGGQGGSFVVESYETCEDCSETTDSEFNISLGPSEEEIVEGIDTEEEVPEIPLYYTKERSIEKPKTSASALPKANRPSTIKVSSHVDKLVEEPITKFLLGMYTRLDSTSDLNGIRKRLYFYIRAHPGEHIATLMKEFKLSPGGVSHHLSVLEKNGFIISHSDGRYKRFFISNNGYINTLNEDYKPIISALKNDNSKRITLFLLAIPMSTQQDISVALNLHPSTVHWHTSKLQSIGLLTSMRDGKNVRYAVQNSNCVLKALSLIDKL